MAVKIKKVLKVLVFLVIGFFIYGMVDSVFGVSNQYSEHAEMMLNGYYELEDDTIDVLFVGNSHVYRYWQSTFAWQDYGIASSALSTSDMPHGAMKNVIIEGCKTQSPKLLVLDATVFANKTDEPSNKIYLLLNNMKYSGNYFDMVQNYCKYSGVTGTDQLQYYFPVVQFHSRWNSLSELDFEQTQKSYLNSCYQEEFLTSTINRRKHITTDKRVPISPKTEDALRDLLEWCREQDTEILFYVAPILKKSAQQGRLNYICDIIKEYDQNVINYNDEELFDAFDFVKKKDFQDFNHTNIRGSYKFTKLFGKYIQDTYNLPDHRGEAGYEEWDVATQEYMNIVTPYLSYD